MIRSCNICQLMERKDSEPVESSSKMSKAILWKRMSGRAAVSRTRCLSLSRDKMPKRLQT